MPLHIHVDSPPHGLLGLPALGPVRAADTIRKIENGPAAKRDGREPQGATAFGRCVGNTTCAATLDSMREVPTWPHAPPAPWPQTPPWRRGGTPPVPSPGGAVD